MKHEKKMTVGRICAKNTKPMLKRPPSSNLAIASALFVPKAPATKPKSASGPKMNFAPTLDRFRKSLTPWPNSYTLLRP